MKRKIVREKVQLQDEEKEIEADDLIQNGSEKVNAEVTYLHYVIANVKIRIAPSRL